VHAARGDNRHERQRAFRSDLGERATGEALPTVDTIAFNIAGAVPHQIQPLKKGEKSTAKRAITATDSAGNDNSAKVKVKK